MASGFFITGTDTEVGKTFVTALLLRELNRRGQTALGMKPIASGCVQGEAGLTNDDVEVLLAAGHHPVPRRVLNPYAFEPPVSPHIAAANAGTNISFEVLKTAYDELAGQADTVLVEGAGGWLAPISDVVDMADLAAFLDVPVVLVVGMRLGCLNHALLTARAIQASDCRFAGWVANRVTPEMLEFDANLATLERRIGAPLLGVVPYAPTGTLPMLGRANLHPLLAV
ncbi:dethiobiotin synthetase [Chitinivorax tropicus]|uniref:ATP-dependent dethiobiotin synthetase BioD n=1 Tax=Chitinivorax tropicus TaxID=714531 RepID=A0A840MML6_9PROT|nr:dethiobiotin synthase [Chitinivorax tropicus]MBB5018187.1 dethiobiotin synthetase [Chitinivorax tropicus]